MSRLNRYLIGIILVVIIEGLFSFINFWLE